MDDTDGKMNGSQEEIAKTWEMVARQLLHYEKSRRSHNCPEPLGILIKWKGSTYIGSIQVIAPDYSEEIVVLSKSSHPLPVELDNAIRKLGPERQILSADDMLDLTGRQHVLRRVENRLTHMTPDQTAYMLLHPPVIMEI